MRMRRNDFAKMLLSLMMFLVVSAAASCWAATGFGSGWMVEKEKARNQYMPPCFTVSDPNEVIQNCEKYLPYEQPEEKARIIAKIATAHLQLGQMGDALTILTGAVEKLPPDQNILTLRCWTQAVLHQQLDQALADCNAALKMNSRTASTLDARGLVYFREGNYGAAISDFNSAVTIVPGLVTSVYVRGLAKLKSGDVAGGNADIATAKVTDPDIATQYAGYGVTP